MNILKELSSVNDFLQIHAKNSQINFIAGNYQSKLSELVFSLAPYGKVAFITFSSTHEKFGKEMLNSLNGVGSKLISLVMPSECSDSVDFFSLLFTLPEDVRFVFTMDKELSHAVTYFSSIKDIPVAIIPLDNSISGILDSVLYLRNGYSIDKVVCNSQKYVIIDQSLIAEDGLYKAYASVISKAVSLIDYRLNCVGKEKVFNKTAYKLLEKTLQDVFNVFSCSPKDRKMALLICSIKAEVANFIVSGELNYCSSVNLVSKLLCKKYQLENLEIASASLILKIYSVCFNIKNALPIVPDYNARAEKISKLFKISEREAVCSLINSSTRYSTFKERFDKAVCLLKDEAERLYNALQKSKSTYLALGGKQNLGIDNKEILELIKFAGDIPEYFNGISILRELGIIHAPFFSKIV